MLNFTIELPFWADKVSLLWKGKILYQFSSFAIYTQSQSNRYMNVLRCLSTSLETFDRHLTTTTVWFFILLVVAILYCVVWFPLPNSKVQIENKSNVNVGLPLLLCYQTCKVDRHTNEWSWKNDLRSQLCVFQSFYGFCKAYLIFSIFVHVVSLSRIKIQKYSKDPFSKKVAGWHSKSTLSRSMVT